MNCCQLARGRPCDTAGQGPSRVLAGFELAGFELAGFELAGFELAGEGRTNHLGRVWPLLSNCPNPAGPVGPPSGGEMDRATPDKSTEHGLKHPTRSRFSWRAPQAKVTLATDRRG